MYRPVLVTAPVIKPVTLAEAKVHCRANDFTDDDVTITSLIAAATTYLDGWTGILGRALCEQSWRQDYDGFYSDHDGHHHHRPLSRSYGFRLRLPLDPVISITSVKYNDAAGVAQTISSGNYTLKADDQGAFVQFITTYVLPVTSMEPASVSVEYKAGYANDVSDTNNPLSTVPAAIRHAMLLLIGHWYENREAVEVSMRSAVPAKLPFAVEALLAPFRRRKF